MTAPRPMGQLHIDAQKDAIITRAEGHGWMLISREPLVLSRGSKQIMVKFNSAGMPNSAFWLHGDEFASMPATGYLNMNTLYDWIASDHGKKP